MLILTQDLEISGIILHSLAHIAAQFICIVLQIQNNISLDIETNLQYIITQSC